MSFGGEVSFGELAVAAERLAAAWRRSPPAGERVALIAENSVGWVECMYAVPMAGQVFVPLNYRLSADELVDQLNVCRAGVLVCDQAQFDRLRPELARARTLRDVVVIDSPRGGAAQRLQLRSQRRSPRRAAGARRGRYRVADLHQRHLRTRQGTLLTHRPLGTAMVANSSAADPPRRCSTSPPTLLCHVSAMNVPLYHLHGRPVVLMPRFRRPCSSQRRSATARQPPRSVAAQLYSSRHGITTFSPLKSIYKSEFGCT